MVTIICFDAPDTPFLLPVADRTIPFPDKTTFFQALAADDGYLASRWLDQIRTRAVDKDFITSYVGSPTCTWYGWYDAIAHLPSATLKQYNLTERIAVEVKAMDRRLAARQRQHFPKQGIVSDLVNRLRHYGYAGLVRIMLNDPDYQRPLEDQRDWGKFWPTYTNDRVFRAILTHYRLDELTLEDLARRAFGYAATPLSDKDALPYVAKAKIFLDHGLSFSFLESIQPAVATLIKVEQEHGWTPDDPVLSADILNRIILRQRYQKSRM